MFHFSTYYFCFEVIFEIVQDACGSTTFAVFSYYYAALPDLALSHAKSGPGSRGRDEFAAEIETQTVLEAIARK